MSDASGQIRLASAPQQVATSEGVSGGEIVSSENLSPGPDSSVAKMGVSPPPDRSPKTPAKRSPKDYIFGKVIGEGSFSTVYLAKYIHTGKEFAIKVCDKRHIIREKKTEYIKREKEVLNLLASVPRSTAPFFVKLDCTFQDVNRLYFVLSYAKNGELLPHINKVGSLDVPCTQFYSAEVLHALEHLHSLGIIHRDLKPENILLNEDMHILITDFGSAKILPSDEEKKMESESRSVVSEAANGIDEENGANQRIGKRKNSFVGTAQYVSPELLTDKPASRCSDLWALGCLLYQMVAGLPPFRSRSEYQIFQKIMKLEYEFPDGFSPLAKDLVEKLLVIDPKDRLGASDDLSGENGCYLSIRSHPFYQGTNFETLHCRTPPKMYPYLPKTSEHGEMRSEYSVPDHLEPGLDERQLTRLLGLDLQDATPVATTPIAASPPPVTPVKKKSTAGIVSGRPGIGELLWGLPSETVEDVEARRQKKMEAQLFEKWNTFVEGKLILKQGLLDKKKGLFARRRMFMLTLGPHLFYVDPVAMVLKGEIPWSQQLSVEPKNFKIFFVHTPNRTYYLEDPEGYALEWCKAIEDMWHYTYGIVPPVNSEITSSPSTSGAS
ncbi:3-phosphoinositide-dependent protein kinase 1 [Hetaerina americana]|uniref:3-phosphoinositide-dependent protein kinase 1 n=1 Tax=Hetaerina americana TaxID=62018 RepID=UPI003A7F337F